MSAPCVALAVSGHGFGHAVRCAQVARALLARGARVLVRSDAPRRLFPEGVEWIASPGWPLDVGVVQHGGLELDIDQTRQQWCEFARHFDRRARIEGQLLEAAAADVVLGDIPPLAFAAAAQAGLPGLALGNFTWDWIYSAWPGFQEILALVREAYARAEAALRLPLHNPNDFVGFKRIEDVPLITRCATRPREAVRAELGIAPNARVVLLSFGAFDVPGLDLLRLGGLKEYVFVVTPPLNVACLPANVLGLNELPADYVSLLAACDVVVTKPGYGIAADCLANRVAMLFADRGPFREYDVLAEALPRLGRARHIPRQDLLRADLGPHLDALLQSDARWIEQPMNGAEVVADRVVHRVTI